MSHDISVNPEDGTAATLGTAKGCLMLFFRELLRASLPGMTPGSVPRTPASELALPGIS